MSDLLIRGMEMPTDGHWGTVSIPFYIHGDGSVSDSKGHIIASAVPVPPHGRLIDADELFKEMERKGWFDNADRDKAEDLVLAAPTIIPAEQAEEGET